MSSTTRSRDPRLDFSERFRNELVEEFARETESFAIERIARAQTRLKNI